MPRKHVLEIKLSIDEAKALVRLVSAGIAQIQADPTPVTNEVTLRRSIDAAARAAEKIKAAMATAEAPPP